MKEISFLKENAQKWKRFESLINSRKGKNPDILADLYVQLTDDLSFARTFYPESEVTRYLNGLAAKFHQEIYRNKKERRDRISEFWAHEQPRIIRRYRWVMFFSISVFIISVLIGVISSANDDSFVHLVLGDSYVKMTLENIRKGDPMAVYKSMTPFNMFLGVTINNIYVAILAFTSGVFFSFGTGYILFSNGIMLGVFH